MTGMLPNVCSKMARKDPVLAKLFLHTISIGSTEDKDFKMGKECVTEMASAPSQAPCLTRSWLTMEEDNRENILVSISQNFCEGFWNFPPEITREINFYSHRRVWWQSERYIGQTRSGKQGYHPKCHKVSSQCRWQSSRCHHRLVDILAQLKSNLHKIMLKTTCWSCNLRFHKIKLRKME